MPKQLEENIKLAQLIPIQVLTAGTENGTPVDMKLSEMYSFDTALVNIEIGDITTGPIKVTIEESDDSTFADGTETVAEGGEEIEILLASADSSYEMEIARTKRYLRAVVVVVGDVEIFIGMLKCNWQKPFPIL